MESWQIGYLAGMVDAECHVGIQKEMSARRATPQYSIHFELAMTDRGPVDFVNSLLPSGKIVHCNAKGRRLPYYRLRVIHQEAISLLRQVLPYLQGKRRQVELCLELEDLRKRLSPSRHHYGTSIAARMPPEFVERAEAIFVEFRSHQLNKKPRTLPT